MKESSSEVSKWRQEVEKLKSQVGKLAREVAREGKDGVIKQDLGGSSWQYIERGSMRRYAPSELMLLELVEIKRDMDREMNGMYEVIQAIEESQTDESFIDEFFET